MTKKFTDEENAILVAMNTVLWMAQECLPLSKYPSVIKFLKLLNTPFIDKLKVNDCTNYTCYKTATDLCSALAQVIDENNNSALQKSPVVTILCDESKDIATHHKLVINARIVDPLTLTPKTFFLTDVKIHGATGQNIFNEI